VAVPFLLTLKISSLEEGGGLSSIKLHQFLSLFSGNLSDIDSSPYIRVVTFIDVVLTFGYNIFHWMFGMGYGGYFTDETGLLRITPTIDRDAFSTTDIISGYFHSAHDTFCTVPLFNGFVGLFLLLKIVFLYIKRVKYNFLAMSAIPWLFLTFYFNPQLGLTGLMFLFAAEYSINGEENNTKKV
jgi:hypothetical protein